MTAYDIDTPDFTDTDPTINWSLCWTINGNVWHNRGFYTFEQIQQFAKQLLCRFGEVKTFAMHAQRMMTVNTNSLLSANSGGEVALAPHLLKTADTF